MPLPQRILETVAFFDIFDYPLTSFEIWQYLPVKTTYTEVRNALTTIPKLEEYDGFFFLPGRKNILELRRERYVATDEKIKKARRRIRLFQWLPGIKLICLANTIGTHNLRPGGDTDLFIVTKNHRLWFVKFASTVIAACLRLRPTRHKNADQICLSFFVDESALNLSVYRSSEDRYLTYWLAGLTPLYGDTTIYNQLLLVNQWLTQELPNWTLRGALPRRRFTFVRRKDSLLGGMFVEKMARKLQLMLMSPIIKQMANRDSRVVLSDHVLKLHTVDRREHFHNEFNKRLASLV